MVSIKNNSVYTPVGRRYNTRIPFQLKFYVILIFI